MRGTCEFINNRLSANGNISIDQQVNVMVSRMVDLQMGACGRNQRSMVCAAANPLTTGGIRWPISLQLFRSYTMLTA